MVGSLIPLFGCARGFLSSRPSVGRVRFAVLGCAGDYSFYHSARPAFFCFVFCVLVCVCICALVIVLDHGRTVVILFLFVRLASFFFFLFPVFLLGSSVLSAVPQETPYLLAFILPSCRGKRCCRHPGRMYVFFSATVLISVNARIDRPTV